MVDEVIREGREGALIELTDRLATVALAPLTRSTLPRWKSWQAKLPASQALKHTTENDA